MNILLTLSYDGTNYCGWQRQINGVSIQEMTERALEDVFGQPVTVRGASRTDAGVHALGQRASFFTDECKIPLDKLPQVINRYLPDDIVVVLAEIAEDSFHPQYGAKRKTYEYAIYNAPYPNSKLRNFVYHVPYQLDVELMREAAAYLIGRHDFAAFCAAGSNKKSTVRIIYELEIEKKGSMITIRACGNGFLYNMVRIIAGTLIYVGCKKIMPSETEGILLSRDRTQAGKTAPPGGLTLVSVEYDD